MSGRVLTMIGIGLALVISTTTLVLELRERNNREEDAKVNQEIVYRRILGEVWQEFKPVYKDFQINMQSEPRSFHDVLEPMIGIQQQKPASQH